LSTSALSALRVAATLVHSVPGLVGRLRSGPVVVADIGHGLDDTGDEPAVAPWLTPCAFRTAVIDAHQRHVRGVRLGIRGVAGDPAIDIGVPRGGQVFPGGIYRVPCEGRWLYAFALCGDAEDYAPLVAGVVEEVSGGRRPRGKLGLRPDDPLGAALCFLEVDGSAPPDDASALELLGALLARFTAEQVCGVPVAAG
jgi:hypothetical protein